LDHKIAIEALEQIDSILAAWDEPHRGDLDMARDTMFDPIERARLFVKTVDTLLEARGLMTRPPCLNDPSYRRVFPKRA
jgi:hypothetical protein